MNIVNPLLLCLLWMPSLQAAVVSSDQQRVEASLTLSADIDLSQELLLGLVDIKVLSSLHEVARWNPVTASFHDLGLAVRAERAVPTPLNIDVVNDYYQCQFGRTFISRELTPGLLSAPNYGYSVRGAPKGFINGRHRVDGAEWIQSDIGRYVVDMQINIVLPKIDPVQLPTLNASQGECMGNVIFLFSLA